MRAHVLVAILPEQPGAAPPTGLVWSHAAGMTAVLSEAPAPLIRLPAQRKDQLRAAAEYQRYLEALRPYGTVIPVKQNTDIQISQIPTLIRANAPVLRELAGSLAGLDQYQISVRWDPAGVLKKFRDTPEIAPLFAAGRVQSTDLSIAVSTLAHRLGSKIMDDFAALATEIIPLPCDANMIANLVMLWPRHLTEKLDETLAAIDAIWTEGFRIRQVGPAAPVSFATLDPRLITKSMKDRAFAQLQLGADVDPDSVAQARSVALREARLPKREIDAAVSIIKAALCADDADGFFLCDVWRDGTAHSIGARQDAA